MFRIRNNPVTHVRSLMRQTLSGLLAAVVGTLAFSSGPLAGPELDPSFGVNGIARTAFGTDNGDTPHDLLIQPDGRILTAGISINNTTIEYFIAMTRHSADGVPDSMGFGQDGKVFTHFTFRDQANAIALQPDGKIVAAGMQAASNAFSGQIPSAYRFNPDGTADTTFAGTGFVASRYDPISSGEHGGVTVLSDGRILAAGRSSANANGGTNGFGMKRFLPGGAQDLSRRIDFNVGFGRSTVAFYGDGRVLWATLTFMNGINQFVMARADSAGTLDPSFGIRLTGIQATSNSWSPRVLVLPGGKILLAGTTPGDVSGTRFSVFRFHADVTIDSTFGTNGRTNVSFTSSDICRDMAVYPDGRILLAGQAGSKAALARLLPEGSLDPAFDDDGMLVSDLNNNAGTHYITRVLVLPDGRILAAGFDFAFHRGDFFLVRYVDDVAGVETPGSPPVRVLTRVYPNPSRGRTAIQIQLRRDDLVEVGIFDVAGRPVRGLFRGRLPAGTHEFRWDGRSAAGTETPPGVFFARVGSAAGSEARKLVRLP